MPITSELAEILHRINDLLPHRSEAAQLEVRAAIEDQVARSETPIGDQVGADSVATDPAA